MDTYIEVSELNEVCFYIILCATLSTYIYLQHRKPLLYSRSLKSQIKDFSALKEVWNPSAGPVSKIERACDSLCYQTLFNTLEI